MCGEALNEGIKFMTLFIVLSCSLNKNSFIHLFPIIKQYIDRSARSDRIDDDDDDDDAADLLSLSPLSLSLYSIL